MGEGELTSITSIPQMSIVRVDPMDIVATNPPYCNWPWLASILLIQSSKTVLGGMPE